MDVAEIDAEKSWEDALSTFVYPSFLASWAWGAFQQHLGNQPKRFAVYEKGKLFGLAQCYIVRAKTGTYLYCPRGPIAKTAKAFFLLVSILKQQAVQNSLDYLLIEPDRDALPFTTDLVKKEELIRHRLSVQPLNSLLLSLVPEQNALFSSFRKTTRALIRKASAIDVTISTHTTLSRFEDFAALQIETTKRQKFAAHTLMYLKEQYSFFAKRDQAILYLAQKEHKALAGAIILLFGKTAVYLHAASNSEGRGSGASHLLVWRAIADAKEKGFAVFDFWGIAPPADPHHRFAGITIFKMGFGGEVVSYPGSFAFPVHPFRYRIYTLIAFLRKAPVLRIAQRILLRKSTAG